MSRVAYQSSNVANGDSSAVVTKPTGLAEGDLMIAWVLSYESAVGAPVGWTPILAGLPGTGFGSFWKIATAGDAAASDFTFTGGTNTVRAGVARFTEAHATAPINASNQAVDTGSSTSGVTPTEGALLLILGGVSNDTGTKTFGSYAVANNNPTWVEIFDNGGTRAGGIYTSIAMAYGPRPENTDTGNATFTISGGGSAFDTCIQIIAIVPDPVYSVTASVASSSLIPNFPIVLEAIATFASSIPVPVITAATNAWSNLAKNVASWLNQSKS